MVVTGPSHPRPLLPGARIAVVAPSSPIPRDRLAAGLETLAAWGYETVAGEHLLATDGGFLAGDDGARARDLSAAFVDEDVDAVWVARGGTGASRMVDLVSWRELRRRPVALLGFSDATALHAAAWHRTSTVSLHAPVVVQLAELAPDGIAARWLRSLLVGDHPAEVPIGGGALRTVAGGRSEGRILGGNLATLCSLVGTSDEPDTRGALLFLEDIDEPPYRIDRMLIHLLRAGVLDEVTGIVTGRFTGSEVRPGMAQRTVDAVLDDTLGHLGVPVLSGLPCGHGADPVTMPLGVRARLDADAGALTLLEAVLTR